MKKSELIARLQADIAAHGDGEIQSDILKALDPLSEEVEAARGKQLAEVLYLRKDSEHKDRYQTSIGTKTAIGLFATVRRIVIEGL